MKRMIGLAASCGIVAVFVLAVPFAASAHEQREIAGGQYSVVVGFLDEPAFAGEKNGLDFRVSKIGAPGTEGAAEAEGTPVVGLFDTLQAEVIFGDQRMALPLEPAFGDLGAYESPFFPTTPGDYTFHIFGTIEGTAVDETFTSSPQGFSPVLDPAPLQFPKQAAATDDSAAMAGTVAGAGGANTGFGAAAAAGFLGVGLAVSGALWLVQRTVAHRRLASASARG